jgi:hypothetical protein
MNGHDYNFYLNEKANDSTTELPLFNKFNPTRSCYSNQLLLFIKMT